MSVVSLSEADVRELLTYEQLIPVMSEAPLKRQEPSASAHSVQLPCLPSVGITLT